MVRQIIPYNPKLKELARNLRNTSSLPEVKLWKILKGKQQLGFDFHRQKPLLDFIADFYCHELLLIIEVDGVQHFLQNQTERDDKKQLSFEAYGLLTYRISASRILDSFEEVAMEVSKLVEHRKLELNL